MILIFKNVINKKNCILINKYLYNYNKLVYENKRSY